MKNLFKKALALTLACLMLLALVSCDKSSAVKKAFEKAEYKVTSVKADSEDAKTLLKLMNFSEDQMKEIGEYEIMLCTSGIKIALVIKFPGSGDLKSFLTVEKEDGSKDTAAYDKAKEDGNINGNCLLLTLSNDARDIFKKA